ncbi:hypothetical protein AAZV13_18G106300 [Glycine max]
MTKSQFLLPIFVFSPLFLFSPLTKPKTALCHHVLSLHHRPTLCMTDLPPFASQNNLPSPTGVAEKPNPSPLASQPNPCSPLTCCKEEKKSLHFAIIFSHENLYLINDINFKWRERYFESF